MPVLDKINLMKNNQFKQRMTHEWSRFILSIFAMSCVVVPKDCFSWQTC